MEKTAKSTPANSSASRLARFAEGVVALGLAYLLAARALDTGSLQQYSLALIFLGIAINCFIKTHAG